MDDFCQSFGRKKNSCRLAESAESDFYSLGVAMAEDGHSTERSSIAPKANRTEPLLAMTDDRFWHLSDMPRCPS
jgi:hypothetical protein